MFLFHSDFFSLSTRVKFRAGVKCIYLNLFKSFRERDLSLTSSFSIWLQWPVLCHVEAEARHFIQVSPAGAGS